MKQHLLLATLKQFDRNTWLLMILMFFVKAGFFMTLPYFTFYLYYKGYSPLQIGCIVGIGPIIAALTNIGSGYLADQFGKKRAMIVAFLAMGLANAGIAYGQGFWLYLGLNIFLSVARDTFDSAMQAHLSESFEKEVQHMVFHFRFMLLNTAAALGPIFGAFFAQLHSKILFDGSAIICLIAAIILAFALKSNEKTQGSTFKNADLTLSKAMKTLIQDPMLRWITLGYFLYWFSYIQLDSTLTQILARTYPKEGTFLFAMIWIINTVLIVIAQLPIAYITRNLPYNRITWVGGLFLMFGFWVLAYFLSPLGLIISIVLITLGEILLSPLSNILISKIAPPALRTTYFGAFNLSKLGMGLAPLLGSAALTFTSPRTLYTLISLLFFLIIFCMHRAFSGMALADPSVET